MNLSRGFFRLWISVSTVWCLLVIYIALDNFINPELTPKYFLLGQDFKAVEIRPTHDTNNPRGSHATGLMSSPNHDIIEFSNNIFVYAERNMSGDDRDLWARGFMRDQVEKRNHEKWQKRSDELILLTPWIIVPPLVLLVLGLSLRWIFAGFKGTQQ